MRPARLSGDGTLGCDAKGDVILAGRLWPALQRLNPSFPEEAINAAIEEVSRDRLAMTLEAANRELCAHCGSVFDHLYQSYQGDGQSVFGMRASG